MTGMIALLYVVVGLGCGLIRLSAVAVGVIAMVPAVVGAFAVAGGGAGSVAVAVLLPLLVIEGAYFVTMLVVGHWWAGHPAQGKPEGRPSVDDVRLPRKPSMHRKP
ncbi:MAG: hypothetical protein NTV73_08640 [Hyphomicrobiales bacterium]|nr:hypothetical protein [Hyphomicrobiales bacterium]